MRLYELNKQLQQLSDLIESGEVTEESLADTIEGVEGMFDQKAESICYVIRNMEASADAVKAEEARLAKRRKQYLDGVERLKGYLKLSMVESGHKSVKSDLFTISLTPPPKVVEIDDERAIPDEYKTRTVIDSVDKKKVLAQLKDGAVIPGAHLGDGNYGLRIK